MTRGDRYARQIAVPGVGVAGQERIAALVVEVEGDGLASEICALYLAGAGVKRLAVSAALAAKVRALNSEIEVIEVIEGAAPGGLVVRPAEELDAVEAGARAARWALARALGGEA